MHSGSLGSFQNPLVILSFSVMIEPDILNWLSFFQEEMTHVLTNNEQANRFILFISTK